MLKKTELHAAHERAGAKLVDFGGWSMPINYGSQIKEHQAVRENVGMFDVSHMTIVDIRGDNSRSFLRHVLANDVAKIKSPGSAIYTGMLNHEGGVIDDLIVYGFDNYYRLVVNCSTREKVLAWLEKCNWNFNCEIIELPELSMVAVQGPKASDTIGALISPSLQDLKPFCATNAVFEGQQIMAARTGYTGEDGFEIIVPGSIVEALWNALLEAGVEPCGLGARDTLRLEAGLNLYGHEMDETVSPLAANMAWTVAFSPEDRDFIGRAALESIKAKAEGEKLVGLVIEGKGILREGQVVRGVNGSVGHITSGSFSPTLNTSIALARVPVNIEEPCEVMIRKKSVPVRITKPRFVQRGKVLL